ncbi:phage holin family protein [Paenibacillus terrae]|uniref:PPE-repeat protein n=1 Tax=Paenibacillus terrae TaxID=159743 RepID=A0A0D7WT63_9BACL|nr:phage holin family protein [Paenibacillus terrae]KJD42340.1 PPE-repeat protein [Paenibacillus terrae]
MDWNMVYGLIDPKLLIVVAVCWVIGYGLKKTPRVPDWSIVYIVTGVAVLLTIWMIGWGPQAIIQGVLAGAFAVYGNQIVKQARKGGGEQ